MEKSFPPGNGKNFFPLRLIAKQFCESFTPPSPPCLPKNQKFRLSRMCGGGGKKSCVCTTLKKERSKTIQVGKPTSVGRNFRRHYLPCLLQLPLARRVGGFGGERPTAGVDGGRREGEKEGEEKVSNWIPRRRKRYPSFSSPFLYEQVSVRGGGLRDGGGGKGGLKGKTAGGCGGHARGVSWKGMPDQESPFVPINK